MKRWQHLKNDKKFEKATIEARQSGTDLSRLKKVKFCA